MNQSILIIGAGVIGCSLARQMARSGCAVTLVDWAESGNGATGSSFAWVNGDGIGDGQVRRSYAELSRLGVAAHERWASDFESRPWFHQRGNIRIGVTAEQMGELETRVEQTRSLDYAAELLTRDDVARLEPTLDLDGVRGGAYFPREGWVDTSLMCFELIRDAVEAGARFLAYHRAIELTDSGAVFQDASGATSAIDADVTVLAAGNGIRPLTRAMGTDFPTLPTAAEFSRNPDDPDDTPSVGMTCVTTPISGAPTRMIQADGVTVRPSPNGGVTMTDHPTASVWDAAGDGLWQAPRLLLDRARLLCPSLKDAHISTVLIGNRVLPADGFTIADWVDTDRRQYAIATHAGITLAPHLADVVSDGDHDGFPGSVAHRLRTGSVRRHDHLAAYPDAGRGRNARMKR